MFRQYLAKRSGREKKVLSLCVGALLLLMMKFVLIDIPSRILEKQKMRLVQAERDDNWLVSRSELVMCLGRKQASGGKGKNSFSALVLPDTVHEIHSITEGDERSLTLHFSEQKVLFEWLLETEANYPVRVSMLKLNNEMDRAEVTLKEVMCHDVQ